jgi:tRNA-Thr(GGU) m(6)t(6)A37 methyltransferase TsaA
VEQQLLHDNGRLTVEPIGVVRSVYRLCVGTPRQGLLAPHARGRIELRKGTVSPDAVEGIDGYSHLWIVFLFHLNTVPTPVDRKKRRTPAKISPPALGGSKKVGVLATRSPHRFNPIGITLARLDRVDIDVVSASGKGAVSAVLHVSGIDLVDGTPVLDVKPYVPAYDAPPRCPGSEHRNQRIVGDDDVRIPEWVGSGLEARRTVTFTETAKSQLEKIVLQEPGALEFYRDGDPETNVRKTTLCIEEVLSIDVRSKYQTCKARKGQSRAERARRLAPAFSLSPTGFAATVSDAGNGVVRSPGLPSLPPLQTNNSQGDCVCYDDEVHPTCTQQIDNLLVSFRVSAAACEDNVEDGGPTVQHMATRGSGAEDRVTVVSVRHVDSFAHNRGTTSSR